MTDNGDMYETQHVHTYTTPGTYYPQATCNGYTATAGPIEVEGDQLETPENLTVTDITDTSAVVSWDAVEDAEHYLVTVQPGDAEPQEVTETTATLEGLEPETDYVVSVVAQAEGIGDSEPATEEFATGTPGTEQLPTPTGLEAEADGANAIVASWDTVDDAEEYLVEYRADGEEDWLSIPATDETTATIEDLEPETTYDVRVTARADGWLDSEPTAPVSATTEAETEQLPTPTGLAVDDTTDTTVTVSWDAVEDAETYLVEYREGDEGDWSALDPTEDTDATITDLTPETEYQVRVTAQADGFDDSDPSEPVTATTEAESEQLPAPTGVTVESTTDTSVTVSWDAVEDADDYVVQYREGDEGDWIDNDPTEDTEDTVTGIEPETEYELQVIAQAEGFDDSDPSDTVTATTDEPAPDQLDTPEGLTSPAQTSTAIDIEWDAVDNAEEYETRYREDGQEDWIDADPVTATAATLDDLTADTTYEIQVRATGEDYEPSEWSDTLTQATEAD